ncbi:ester cyclase [Flavihumibacter petaseus]|uniref:Ester cyclase n=1 Tax=Flavihumibacter petaseus NBRC 106054 TaxID=1220578 RepID=A0A0E9N2Y1_9BACT|nr:ester cyclase [Flavihumibacter petaseus]GAO44143.1 hypothetical protein FPE01S_03_01810 [Flavihumibacter petaseus NBRC 106054]
MYDNNAIRSFANRYINALNTLPKTRTSLDLYMTDQHLIEHILFFESVFPHYQLQVDELICEGNKFVILARFQGKHEGDFNGLTPTFKNVEMPVAVRYEVVDDKIVSHWLLADQITLLEQLGVSAAPAAV